MKDHFSHSQINMFKRCPRQYRYRYIEGKKYPPKWSLVAGKTGHRVLEFNNIIKKDTGEDVSRNDIVEFYSFAYDEEIGKYEKINMEGLKKKEAKKVMLSPIEQYFKESSYKGWIPSEVEKEYNITFTHSGKKDSILGYIDVEYQDKNIIQDYKFTRRSPNINTLYNSTQLDMYALMYFTEHNKLPMTEFEYLIATKTPKVKNFPIAKVRKQLDRFYDDLSEVIKAINISIQTDNWIRNSSGYYCSPTGCGYWDICRPGEKKLFFDLQKKMKGEKK